jgi:hypothetical protein
MPFPNPAGYYGLKLSESLDRELSDLTDKPLLEVIHDLIESIRRRTDFVTYVIHFNSAAEIEALSKQDKLALLRWLCERLEWLNHPNTIRNKETWSADHAQS